MKTKKTKHKTPKLTSDNTAQQRIRELQKALKWAYCQAATMEAFYAGTLSAKDLMDYRGRLMACKELLK